MSIKGTQYYTGTEQATMHCTTISFSRASTTLLFPVSCISIWNGLIIIIIVISTHHTNLSVGMSIYNMLNPYSSNLISQMYIIAYNVLRGLRCLLPVTKMVFCSVQHKHTKIKTITLNRSLFGNDHP